VGKPAQQRPAGTAKVRFSWDSLTTAGGWYRFATGDSSLSAAATAAVAVGRQVSNAERSLVAPARVRLLAAYAVVWPPNLSLGGKHLRRASKPELPCAIATPVIVS
jgi:hypothetical protein